MIYPAHYPAPTSIRSKVLNTLLLTLLFLSTVMNACAQRIPRHQTQLEGVQVTIPAVVVPGTAISIITPDAIVSTQIDSISSNGEGLVILWHQVARHHMLYRDSELIGTDTFHPLILMTCTALTTAVTIDTCSPYLQRLVSGPRNRSKRSKSAQP